MHGATVKIIGAYIPRYFATLQWQCVRLPFLQFLSCSHFVTLFSSIILYPTDFPSLFLFRSLLLIFPSHHAVSPFCLGRSNLEGNPGVRRQTTRRAASRRPGDNFWKVNRASGGAATGKSNLVSSCGFVTRECGEAGREGVAMILRWRREGRTEMGRERMDCIHWGWGEMLFLSFNPSS